MNKEILIALIIEHYKIDLLGEHIIHLTDQDLFYENIKLNESHVLKSVFEIIGFPFHGKEITEPYSNLYRFLEEYYIDHIYSTDHKNLDQLIEKASLYINWLLEQKNKFDKGTIDTTFS